MSKRWYLAALGVWPGLPQIWLGEEWLGLALAGLFAVALNLAIAARYIWTEALDPSWAQFVAALAGATWALSLAYTLWWLWRCHPESHREAIDQHFHQAVDLYLQGRWEHSRRRLEQTLALDENDADAWMQLGSLFVRTGRADEGRHALRQCLVVDPTRKWRWEVEQALTRLDGPAA
jgi:cytochrome c-type biogenesis protein CcmH/NrfG